MFTLTFLEFSLLEQAAFFSPELGHISSVVLGVLGAVGSRGYFRGAVGSQRVWRSGAVGSPAVGSRGVSRGCWLSWGFQGLLAHVFFFKGCWRNY